jgi:cell division protein FtsW
MVVASLFSLSFFKHRAGVIFAIALGVQAAVFVTPLGVTVNGNTNWLQIGIFTLQPSEFIKLSLILFISAFMASRYDEMFDARRFMWPVLIRGLVAIALVLYGQDLGTSIIIVLIIFGSLFLAGTPGVSMRLPALIVIVGGAIAASGGSRAKRIFAWLNPTDDSSPYTWQSLHGIWALAAGRITGAGLGQSRMKWSWIPEVENDFIFAIIGEELGLIGALIVIGLFVFLTGSMIQIFLRTEDHFARFVAGGIMVWISLQAIINIMVVLQLAPVLGVPLPLISAGGSSLISSPLAIGVMLAIERQNHASGAFNGRSRPAANRSKAQPRARVTK